NGAAASTNDIVGAISVPGEQDIYSFSVATPGLYYFDALSNVSLVWSLEYAGGTVVANKSFNGSDGWFAPKPVLALNPGDYRLTISGNNDSTNNYSFRFLNLNEATLIVPGTVVTNTLDPATETHLYQFTAAVGDQFQFDRLSLTAAD